VAGALTHDGSWSSIFLEGKVLTYSCLTRATVKVKVEGLCLLPGGHPSNC
jgi:hypothetical protein